MSEVSKAQLTEGPVGKILVNKTIPMYLGILSMIAFNLVDTYFIGLLGTVQLAAISFTFPVVYIISGLAMGLGTGTSAVVSKAIGVGNQDGVRRLTSDSLLLSAITAIVFVIIGIFTFDGIFTLIGADSKTLPYIKEYMYYWYPGMLFVVIPMVGNNAIRATGDMKTPSMVMGVAVILNFILDPILIFGWGPIPKLGIAGAAIATVISRAVTFLVAIYILYYREKMLSFKFPGISQILDSWRKILYVALPSAGTSLIIPVAVGILTSLVASYGREAVAAFGVATRMEAFSLSVLMALGSVLNPFIGQNFGAGKYDRLMKGIRLSVIFSLVWGLFSTIIFFIFGSYLASMFSDNAKVVEIIIDYLLIVPLGYGAVGILMLSNVSFNVLNKPYYSAILTITRMFVILVPLAYLGSYLFGLSGIFYSSLSASIISGIAAYIWLRNYLKKIIPAEWNG